MNKLAQVDIGKEFFGSNTSFGGSDLGTIGKLVSTFLAVAFVIAGVILLFFFIRGGIEMITAAGGEPQKFEDARKTIFSAVIGFVIVFASYWIVQLIGTLTGVPILPGQ